MVAVGEPVYNTEQRRERLRQLKQYLDQEWLKRQAEGKLQKKIVLPNAKINKRKRKRKRKIKTKRKRRIKLFKVIYGTKTNDQIDFKQGKIIKRKNRKYKKLK